MSKPWRSFTRMIGQFSLRSNRCWLMIGGNFKTMVCGWIDNMSSPFCWAWKRIGLMQYPVKYMCFCEFLCVFTGLVNSGFDCMGFQQKHVESTKVEAGNLERSYRRAPKGTGEKGKNPADPGGICHLCKAGLKDFDWEDPTSVMHVCFFLCMCVCAKIFI